MAKKQEPIKEKEKPIKEKKERAPKKKIVIFIVIASLVIVSIFVYLILTSGVLLPKGNETEISGFFAKSTEDIKEQQDSLKKMQDLLSSLFG